jgi:prepilin signal peptidase PulO-like enzyme (type II secretory pathway)
MTLSFILIALIGLGLAVLVNYLADVLPHTRRFTRPACPQCEAPFPTQDYLLMRRCRSCGRRRSKRSIIVLLLGMPAAVYVWLVEPKLGLFLGLVVLTYLALVFVIDVEQILQDQHLRAANWWPDLPAACHPSGEA